MIEVSIMCCHSLKLLNIVCAEQIQSVSPKATEGLEKISKAYYMSLNSLNSEVQNNVQCF